MKFLCVCEMGTVRSGAMAITLKAHGQSDVLACGWRTGSPETLSMLCSWADAIVVMQLEFIDRLREKAGSAFDPRKILLVDVGPDIYGHPMHDGLLKHLWGIVGHWKNIDFKLTSALGHRLPI